MKLDEKQPLFVTNLSVPFIVCRGFPRSLFVVLVPKGGGAVGATHR
jgi:hypothetical protein